MTQHAGPAAIQPGQLLSKAKLEGLLAGYEPPGGPASSVYVRPGEAGEFLEASGSEGRAWRDRLDRIGRPVLNSDTGIAGLRAGPEALVIAPPFPLAGNDLVPSWDTAPLLGLLETDYTVGVVLLRLGRFLVAVYKGGRLLSSKTDTRYVKGRHHAGGTSQKRFQRIREGQVQRLYDKACGAAQRQFDPFAGQLDYILLGGERFTLDGFMKACDYLERWRGRILGRRLNVREPKHEALERVAGMLRESRVWVIEW
jgi:hypothetical protein